MFKFKNTSRNIESSKINVWFNLLKETRSISTIIECSSTIQLNTAVPTLLRAAPTRTGLTITLPLLHLHQPCNLHLPALVILVILLLYTVEPIITTGHAIGVLTTVTNLGH